MSVKKFALVLLPSAVFLALTWSLANPAPAYAVLTPQIVSVDPGSGSPVGSNVCITARIEQDFDYRAMRIRFGNEGWQEGTSLEFKKCFVTGHLSPGWYEIRVEADRLGGNWSNITSATQSYELTAQPQPTQPPPPPKGPDVEFTLTPSGGADIGTKVTIEVWVDSTNPGAIRITVPCGEVPVEHTTPQFSTTWNTAGCGAATETVRVCARDVNDPNWANQTCSERSYTLSSPPASAPTAQFWSDATSIQSGQCTWLRWKTTNASVVDIDGDVVAASGEMQVCPSITKYYSLKAQGEGGVATRSLGINVYNTQVPTPPTQVVNSFKTGDVIDIAGQIYIIVNGERRWVPNEASLDALGLGRDKVNNKGFSNSALQTIPKGPDIPAVNVDYGGFMAFKNAYFPNTDPIVTPTPTPAKTLVVGPTPTRTPTATQTLGQTQGTQPEGLDTGLPRGWDPGTEPSGWDKFLAFLGLPGITVHGFSAQDLFYENQCTWHVAGIREDVANWIGGKPRHAYLWAERASQNGARYGVYVIDEPRVGSIAVWEPGCDGADAVNGHVAYVTGWNASTQRFTVSEMNWGQARPQDGVRLQSCMTFISLPSSPSPAPDQPPSQPAENPSLLELFLEWLRSLFGG